MKQCTKCKEGKDESGFHKDKSKKDGLRNDCKECCGKRDKENYGNNREEKLQYAREYRLNHREEKLQYAREYNEAYREERNQKAKEDRYSPLEYNSASQVRKEIGLYEEIRQSINANVEAKCANCDNGFEPTKLQIQKRLDAINGNGNARGECKLYCSNECKEICPVYRQRKYPKGHKPDLNREVQSELANMVLERDEYICIICQRHQNEIEMQCHHMEGIRGNPLESADMDTCTTLCKDCHKEVHSEPGCTYNDLKCLPHLKYK